MSKQANGRVPSLRSIDFLSLIDWMILPKDPALRGHIRTMRRRIVANLLQEAKAGARMAFDSMRADKNALTKVDKAYERHVVWAEGFIGEIGNYFRFARDARELGIQIICPYGGHRNVAPWKVSRARVVDTYHRVADVTGRAPVVGGHSKGGQDTASAAPDLEGLEKIILVGSPRQGPAQQSFRWLMETLHRSKDLGPDVDHEQFDEVIQSGVDVVVIASDDDWIVRPYEARVPGARNKRLGKLAGTAKTAPATERRIFANHVGLFVRAKDIIFRELEATE